MTYHYEPHEIAHSKTPHTCSRGDPSKPPPMWVQDGWIETVVNGFWTRVPRMVRIQPEWNKDRAAQCQYTRRSIDKDCEHCERRNT